MFDTSKNKYCQAAALCMTAQGELSHSPGKDWKCYSEDASTGACSNLGLGFSRSDCVDGFIEDGGSNNAQAGHRGWMMTTSKKDFAYGATNNAVAFWVFGVKHFPDSIVDSYSTVFVVWPPAGPVPNNLVYDRWSFCAYDGRFTFTNVEIKMTLNGKPVKYSMEFETTTRLVWWPENIDYNSEKEQRVKVSITADVRWWEKGGEDTFRRETFNYEVIIYQED